MSSSVDMPALGESVTEGTVTRWLKAVGDRVEVDEPLLEVSTDKVDTEIPSPVAGVLQEILVEEDETVAVGAKLAVIGDGEAAEGSDDANESESEPEPAEKSEPEQESEPEPQTVEPSTDKDASQENQDTVTGDADESSDGSSDESSDGSEASSDSSSDGPSSGGTEIVMPALGESVTEGTVTRWLKAEGDTVEVDEPLLEVSTDKVDTEIPSPVAGTLQKILVAEDETVEVGAPLALVGDGSGDGGSGDGDSGTDAGSEQVAPEPKATSEKDSASESAPEAEPDSTPEPEKPEAESEQPEQPSASQEPQPEPTSEPAPAPASERPSAPAEGAGGDAASYVTPLVRKLASEHGVDLAALSGTGVGGRIRKQDVLAAAEAARAESDKAESDKAEADKAEADKAQTPQAEAKQAGGAGAAAGSAPGASPASGVGPQRGTTEKMSRLRKVIASRMVESLQTSAQLTTVLEVDLTKVARLRGRAKDAFASREGVKLSYLPFLALATVEALKAHPKVNAMIDGETIVYPAQENLGVAVDTDRGLLVPVIRDAGDLNIAGLARKIADLADRTRNNKVTPDELGGGTFTLTNTGSRGALFDTPIINQPQVAILGTGALVKRPVVVVDSDGSESIAIRSMMYLALSYDHRLVDGADAARFLSTIKERLEEGAFEADLNL